jgi:hypothetical protein
MTPYLAPKPPLWLFLFTGKPTPAATTPKAGWPAFMTNGASSLPLSAVIAYPRWHAKRHTTTRKDVYIIALATWGVNRPMFQTMKAVYATMTSMLVLHAAWCYTAPYSAGGQPAAVSHVFRTGSLEL